MLKIGIPRALLYYKLYPFWKTFYEELGCEILPSPRTNKYILDLGVKNCVDEACLPVKVFHGHIESIKDKVDFLFIPRVTSLSYGEFTCPKLCGLPEMILNSIKDLPRVIAPDFNLHDRKVNLDKTISEMIKPLEIDFNVAKHAYNSALKHQEYYCELLSQGVLPEEAMDYKKRMPYHHRINQSKGVILILSHPYNLYDSFINMNIIQKIYKMGYRVQTVEEISPETINRHADQLPKKMFWTFGRELIGAGMYALTEGSHIDGIIFLSSFACGLDSIIADYVERKVKRRAIIPFMQLTIDEHTGEAGIDTRIEAFLEMIDRRKSNDRNISSHG